MADPRGRPLLPPPPLLPRVTVCPERVARDADAGPVLARYARWKRYGRPPDEADLDAFDLIEDTLAAPVTETP